MEVYTLSLYEKAEAMKLGFRVLDISPKGETCFAPSLTSLLALERRQITQAQFADQYYAEMRQSFNANATPWLEALHSPQTIGFVCGCTETHTCHREYLLDIFRKVSLYCGRPFNYRGDFKATRQAA